MKRAPVLDYTFSVAKVRALEKFLLTREVFEEAIASGLGEALKIFAETVYSDEILHVKNSRQLEAILDQEAASLKNLCAGLILDKGLLCLLEKADVEDICRVSRNYKNAFLLDYIMYVIDMHNIKNFLRLYLLGEAQEKLISAITCEGFLKKKDLVRLYSSEPTAFLNHLEYVHKNDRTIDYAYQLKEAIQKTLNERKFVYLEKAIDDFLIQVLKPAKYLVFGPEPILAFYFAKLNEINLMRMIILAKFNGVSADLIKERLNAVYA